MSDKNIDKDIEILKSIQNCIRANMLDLESEELQNKDLRDIKAIENILKDLETWKKIAEKLAEDLSKHIGLNDKDAIIKIYREKVEEDETHS